MLKNVILVLPKCVICEVTGSDFRHKIGSPSCLTNQEFFSGVQLVRRTMPNAVRVVQLGD